MKNEANYYLRFSVFTCPYDPQDAQRSGVGPGRFGSTAIADTASTRYRLQYDSQAQVVMFLCFEASAVTIRREI